MKFGANRRIPSTTSLQSFELVARTLSITQAAGELCVSPGAVSRQIAELEEFLGTKLFRREKQRLVLNADGEKYANQVRSLLAELEQATLAMRAQGASAKHFRLSVPATFGNRWLLPRLGELYAHHPEALLDISTRVGMPDFASMRLDAALCYCLTPPAGFDGVHIYPLRLVAVAAARLFPGGRPPKGMAAFEKHALMEQSTVVDGWSDYFDTLGQRPSTFVRGARFDLLSMGHEVALAGLGIALLPAYLIGEDLKAGRLVKVHPHQFDMAASYKLIYPSQNADAPALRRMRDWLLELAERYPP